MKTTHPQEVLIAPKKIAAQNVFAPTNGRFMSESSHRTGATGTRVRRRQALAAAAFLSAWPGAGWAQRASGAPYAALAALTPRLERELTDVRSLVVVHAGQPVYSYYRNGWDADSLQPVNSVTKSVVSLLFGAALADGHVRSVDGLLAEALPELVRAPLDARVRQLRWAHLLGLTAGWATDQTARRDRDDDLLALAGRPFVAAPGERFAYDNGAYNLLAIGLAREVRGAGQPATTLAQWAAERLFAPLGITRFDWRGGAQGHSLGAFGLRLATPDMARIGELVRLGGSWQGRELVPADFLRVSTTRQSAGGPPNHLPYGYGWWVGQQVRIAAGLGGQLIWIAPGRQLVVAATSASTPESAGRGQALTFIRRDIWPLIGRV